MTPFELRTARLVLNQPADRDIDAITEYCQDPQFTRFMTLPVPYRRTDAEHFVRTYVPTGWASDTEYTWAIREGDREELLGMIGLRTGRPDVGYWLGTPHRRRGYMTEAVRAVTGWALASGFDHVEWECVLGNVPSAAVARAAGFAFTGEGPSILTFPDGSHPPSWHGVLPPPKGDPLPWPSP